LSNQDLREDEIKNRERTGKKTCKPVEQEENHEKGPTLVVGKKPNGKSQMKSFRANLGRFSSLTFCSERKVS
jgi:hypothetical protein